MRRIRDARLRWLDRLPSASEARGMKRKLTIVVWVVIGASVGWAASMHLWWAGLVRGNDDPRMLLVVLGCTILTGAYGARGHREVILRLAAYASLFATLAWLLRPLTSGTSRLPREWRFANYHFQEFYPSLIVPFAIIGGIIAVAFARSLRPGGTGVSPVPGSRARGNEEV